VKKHVMIFRIKKNKNKTKKDLLVWCDDPLEDEEISMFARLLVNNDRSHLTTKVYQMTDFVRL
jgi:hypothetical protein